MEYASRGNLFQLIRKDQLPADRVRPVFRAILEAVLYLHDNLVIHRDIKPENILLDESLEPKLCDFGWSVGSQTRKTFCGTFEYMAPEIINCCSYNLSIDIWSLGVLLYEMIEHRAPFKARSLKEIKDAQQKPLAFSPKFSA